MKKDSAHPVPTQCPHSAHTVPTQCPLEFYGISCMVGMTKAFYLILKTRFYPERQNAAKLEWALCGHCVGTVWALCGHCVGTVLPRLMRKLLLRVRASPALDGRRRQPGRRTRKKGEGPLNKRMRNDNLLHDTLSTCAAHHPTDGHVSDLPPMAASRATTKNKRTWPQSAGRPHIPSLHSGASEINARSPIACKVATSYTPPCNPESQC